VSAALRQAGLRRPAVCAYVGLTAPAAAVQPEADLAAVLSLAAHIHAKDILATLEGWLFTAIREGSLDYAAIITALIRAAPDLSIGLELQLRLHRPGWSDPVRRGDPPPLPVLRQAIQRSLAFWQAHLAGPGRPAVPSEKSGKLV
jgi:sugar phosphate isomerase/epimerase